MPRKKTKAFTLIEIIISVAVFSVVAVAVYGVYIKLFDLVRLVHYRNAATNLANEELETVRSIPYASIGIVNGIPNGILNYESSIIRGNYNFNIKRYVRNIDQSFDGLLGGTPNDISPADNKLVSVLVSCESCDNFTPIEVSSLVAPKNLETSSNNGALFVRVFDSNGLPVPQADLRIQNVATTSTVIINDATDNNGLYQLIDVPPGNEAYYIRASKDDYSSDYTQSTTSGLVAVKPNSTIVVQQVTQTSFAIDRLSTLNIRSVRDNCSAVPNYDFSMRGYKKLFEPNVYKYNKSHTTNSSGSLVLSDMEWDTYEFTGTDPNYTIVGVNPVPTFSLVAGTSQDLVITLDDKKVRTLVVAIRDASSLLPISDARVEISEDGNSSVKYTGRGHISQSDWSGGFGQLSFNNPNMFYGENGNIDYITTPGNVLLKNVLGQYASPGVLESSIFDAGEGSSFHEITWNPANNNASTSLKFQLATATTSTTTLVWSYLGPDGTNATYFDSTNHSISNIHNGDRYLRYKAHLETASSSITPILSDLGVTFTSSCVPPGQTHFSNLENGETYTINVSKDGYVNQEMSFTVNKDWEMILINLSPN